MPEALAGKTSLTGIEADASTARIAALLYPNAWIRHEDFTKARLAQTYALAIGNPPYVAAKFMLQKRLSCAAVWPTCGLLTQHNWMVG